MTFARNSLYKPLPLCYTEPIVRCPSLGRTPLRRRTRRGAAIKPHCGKPTERPGRLPQKEKGGRMPLTKTQKEDIVEKFRRHEGDTGSPEVQVALITGRIDYLTKHLQQHRKDHHSRRGLLKLVGRRRRHLDYLRDTDPERYRALISRLNLRK